MSTPARQMQSALRSTEEQNAINARLIRSIVDRNKVAFDQALSEGADVNAVGVRVPGRAKPTTHAPLISAIYAREPDFVKRLIDLGADVTVKDNRGISAVSACINVGYHNMLAAVLHANPNVIDSAGVNLVMQAILSFSSVGLIKGSTSCKELNDLGYYYHGDTITPPDTRGVELDYEGNLDVIRTLLLYAAARKDVLGITVSKDGSRETTPWDLIQNPRPYIQAFLNPGVNPRDTVRCLTQPDDPEPQVLNFEVQFFAIKKPADPREVWVKVRYDFSDLINELRLVVKEYRPNYELEQRFASTTQQHVQKFEVVQQQLGVHEERLGVHEEKIQILSRPQEEQAQFRAWLDQKGYQNVREFHAYLDRQLENFVQVLKLVSTGQVKGKLKDPQIDFLVAMLGNISSLTNTIPFLGASVAGGLLIFKRGTDKIAETRKRNIAEFCAKFFGNVDQTREFCARVARTLSMAYAQPLLALADGKTAEAAKQGTLRKARKELLRESSKSPAEQAAIFAVLCMFDALSKADTLGEAVQREGLETVLTACMVRKEPPNKKSMEESWITKVTKAAFGNGLLTQSGAYWHPQDFFTRPFVYVREDARCYAHAGSNMEYGWRLASTQDIAQMPAFRPIDMLPREDVWFSQRTGSTSSSADHHSSGKSSNGSPERKLEPVPIPVPIPIIPITPAYAATTAQSRKPVLEPVVALGVPQTAPAPRQQKRM